MGTERRHGRRDKRRMPCELPLLRQLEGPERRTVRLGEHPRSDVHRLDLLDDDCLDRFRARHPVPSEAAIDAALLLDERLEQALGHRRLGAAELGVLPQRPLLAVFVCFACGCHAVASCAREWSVDAAMRASGASEREVVIANAARRP